MSMRSCHRRSTAYGDFRVNMLHNRFSHEWDACYLRCTPVHRSLTPLDIHYLEQMKKKTRNARNPLHCFNIFIEIKNIFDF